MQNKKNNIKIVAVTGGIGSGKSLALSIIEQMGFFTISCDDIVSDLYSKRRFLKELKKIFPLAVFGRMKLVADKKIIAKEVFEDSKKREKLNNLTHLKVFERAFKECRKHGKSKGVAFVEVPLLFESHSQDFFDGVIVVKRDKSERIKSVMERSNLTKEQVESRMNAQIDYENFDFSNYVVIINSGNANQLKEKVENKVKEFL